MLDSRGKIPILKLFLYFYLELHKIHNPTNRSRVSQNFNFIVFSDIGPKREDGITEGEKNSKYFLNLENRHC